LPRGLALNYADSSGWVLNTSGVTQTGYYGGNFTINGSTTENQVIHGTLPDGTRGLIWNTPSNDTSSDADGGWNKDISGLTDVNSYISVVYVRRNGSSTTGTFYHGCHGSHTLNLNGTANTNPYFNTPSLSQIPQDVWCVSIGFIRGNADTNTTNTVGGLYRCDTGERIVGYNDYRMKSGSTVQRHRTYLYYDDAGTSSFSWAKPMFYVVDGSEPSMSSLVKPKQDTNANINIGSGTISSGAITSSGAVTAAQIGVNELSPLTPVHVTVSSNASALTLQNTTGGAGANVGLDFITYTDAVSGYANPGARISGVDDGAYGANLTFYGKAAAVGGALSAIVTIKAKGDLQINSGDLQIGSTTVIDSSRNFINSLSIANNLTGVDYSGIMYDSKSETAQTNFSSNALTYGSDKADIVIERRHSSTKDSLLGYAASLIDLRANNTTDSWSAAHIIGLVDPESGSNYQGGLVFSTSSGGTSSPTGRRTQGAAPTARMLIGATGNVRILTGGLYMGSNEVIDSARNLTNIGTINSGDIFSTGNITANGYLQAFSFLYTRNNLRVLNAAGTGWKDWAVRSNGNYNLDVGTISSGAITATNISVGNAVGNTRSEIDTNALYTSYYNTETSPRIQLGRDVGIAGGAGLALGGNNSYALIGTNNTSGSAMYFKAAAAVGSVTTNPDMTLNSSGNLVVRGTISSGAINATGDITITSTYPKLSFVDTDNNPDISIIGGSGQIAFYDETNSGYVYQYISNQHNFAAKNLTNIGTISSGSITVVPSVGYADGITINAGDVSTGSTGAKQIIMSFGGSSNIDYAHSIRTRHNSSADTGNTVEVYLWDYGTDSSSTIGTKRALVLENSTGLDLLTGGYRVGGQTVIDASRNITAGTISSGAITSTGDLTLTADAYITTNTSDGSDNGSINISGGGAFGDTRGASLGLAGNEDGNGGMVQIRAGQGSYSQIRMYSGGTERVRMDNGGLNILSGTLGVGSTTVIDSSRNLTNIGTITNSGQISSSGNLVFTDKGDYIQFGSGGTDISWTAPVIFREQAHLALSDFSGVKLGGFNGTSYGPRVHVKGDGNLSILEAGLQIGNTTVIDSSRNLTNIGTISSGAITASSGITATGPFKSGGSNNYILFDYDGDFTGGDYYAIQDTSANRLRISYAFSATDNLELDSSGNFYVNGGNSTFAGTISSGDITATSSGASTVKISGNFPRLFFEDTAGSDLDAYIVNNANGLFFGKTNSPTPTNDILSLDLSSKNATFAGIGIFNEHLVLDDATRGIVHSRENLAGVPLEDGLSYFAFNHNASTHPDSESQFDTMERVNITTFKGSGTFSNASPFTLSADYYLVEFHGYLLITTAGDYRFGVNADDAVDMYIDGIRVADDYSGHGATGFFNDSSPTSIYLTVGYHKLFARFEELAGGDSCQLGWNGGSGTTLVAIPAGNLYHNATDLTKAYNGTIYTVGAITSTGDISGATIIKSGGTDAQFLKADGSVQSTSASSPQGTTSPFNASANTLTFLINIAHLDGLVTGSQTGVLDLSTGELEINSQGEINIKANSIEASKIAANTITASEIASNTITGTQINADLLNVQHFDNVSADIKSHLTTETFVPLSREGQVYVQRTSPYTGSNSSFFNLAITQVRNSATYVAIFSGVLGDVSGGRVQYSINGTTWVNASGNTNISWSAGTYRGYTYVYTGQITTLSGTQSTVYWRVYFSGSYNHTQLSLNVMMDNTQ